jgi:hypothetical protein
MNSYIDIMKSLKNRIFGVSTYLPLSQPFLFAAQNGCATAGGLSECTDGAT